MHRCRFSTPLHCCSWRRRTQTPYSQGVSSLLLTLFTHSEYTLCAQERVGKRRRWPACICICLVCWAKHTVLSGDNSDTECSSGAPPPLVLCTLCCSAALLLLMLLMLKLLKCYCCTQTQTHRHSLLFVRIVLKRLLLSLSLSLFSPASQITPRRLLLLLLEHMLKRWSWC